MFIGISEIVADEAGEDDVESIDLDLGSFKEGSRTGKANYSWVRTWYFPSTSLLSVIYIRTYMQTICLWFVAFCTRHLSTGED